MFRDGHSDNVTVSDITLSKTLGPFAVGNSALPSAPHLAIFTTALLGGCYWESHSVGEETKLMILELSGKEKHIFKI